MSTPETIKFEKVQYQNKSVVSPDGTRIRLQIDHEWASSMDNLKDANADENHPAMPRGTTAGGPILQVTGMLYRFLHQK